MPDLKVSQSWNVAAAAHHILIALSEQVCAHIRVHRPCRFRPSLHGIQQLGTRLRNWSGTAGSICTFIDLRERRRDRLRRR